MSENSEPSAGGRPHDRQHLETRATPASAAGMATPSIFRSPSCSCTACDSCLRRRHCASVSADWRHVGPRRRAWAFGRTPKAEQAPVAQPPQLTHPGSMMFWQSSPPAVDRWTGDCDPATPLSKSSRCRHNRRLADCVCRRLRYCNVVHWTAAVCSCAILRAASGPSCNADERLVLPASELLVLCSLAISLMSRNGLSKPFFQRNISAASAAQSSRKGDGGAPQKTATCDFSHFLGVFFSDPGVQAAPQLPNSEGLASCAALWCIVVRWYSVEVFCVALCCAVMRCASEGFLFSA